MILEFIQAHLYSIRINQLIINLINIPQGGVMFSYKNILKILATFLVVSLIASCSDSDEARAKSITAESQPIHLDVYKNVNCCCCKKWISHVDGNGFHSKVHNRNDVSVMKEKLGIKPRYYSCHTAVSEDGYVFEGHIPAKSIQQFLSEKHADTIIGLSAPGMPLGSPGMEVDDKFQAYKVLLLKSDGSHEVYAEVNSLQEQL